jgi:hypothetical protein
MRCCTEQLEKTRIWEGRAKIIDGKVVVLPRAFLTVAEKLFPENMDKIGRVKSLSKPVTLPMPRHSSSDRSPRACVWHHCA